MKPSAKPAAPPTGQQAQQAKKRAVSCKRICKATVLIPATAAGLTAATQGCIACFGLDLLLAVRTCCHMGTMIARVGLVSRIRSRAGCGPAAADLVAAFRYWVVCKPHCQKHSFPPLFAPSPPTMLTWRRLASRRPPSPPLLHRLPATAADKPPVGAGRPLPHSSTAPSSLHTAAADRQPRRGLLLLLHPAVATAAAAAASAVVESPLRGSACCTLPPLLRSPSP